MINELDVYLNVFHNNPVQAGRLVYSAQDHRALFEYDEAFLGAGFSLSPIQLPLEKGIFRADRQKYPDDPLYGLHGVFADSLPDTWGRKVQDLWFHKIGIEYPHPFERLAYIGHFSIGALSYEPSIKFKKFGNKISDLAKLRKAAIGVLKGDVSAVSASLGRTGGSAGGMYPKFLIHFNPQTKQCTYGLPPQKGDIPAIIKVPSTANDETQNMEYIYSLMASQAGICIPPTYLLTRQSASYYIIRRFDVNDDGSRNHIHSMAGMMGINYADKVIDYRQAFRLLKGLSRDNRQLAQLFRRMIFNILSGNHDDHTKNISFIMDSEGSWSLSPAYDLSFSQTMDGARSMTVNGAASNPSIKDAETLAIEFDIKNWRSIITEVKEPLSQWRNLADVYGISNNMQKKVYMSLKKIDKLFF